MALLWVLIVITCQLTTATIVDIQPVVTHTVDKHFISTALDFILLAPETHWDKLDFGSPRFRTLLHALSPSIIRLGGSPADWTYFSEKLTQLAASGIQPSPFVITEKDVDDLVSATRDTGTRLLYDINLQLRFGQQWNPNNAVALLDYMQQKGYGDNIDFELGNEPDAFNHPGQTQMDGHQLARDFKSLRSVLATYPNIAGSKLVGPDIVGLEGAHGLQMLVDFLNDISSTDTMDAITFHHYYFRGDVATWKDYVNPNNFNNLAGTINTVLQARHKTKTQKWPLWLGETSDAWHGGTGGVSDRFVSSFLWLEKLGLSAKMGIDVVVRQTLYGNNYSLLNKDMYPNPDFWTSYMHKQLVGPQVVNATVNASSTAVRVYVHCANTALQPLPAGALVVFALNVSPNKTDVIKFSQSYGSEGHLYLCTPPPGDDDGLLSHYVAVNDVPLKMISDTQLPALRAVDIDIAKGVKLPPYSFFFLVLPDAKVQACVT